MQGLNLSEIHRRIQGLTESQKNSILYEICKVLVEFEGADIETQVNDIWYTLDMFGITADIFKG